MNNTPYLRVVNPSGLIIYNKNGYTGSTDINAVVTYPKPSVLPQLSANIQSTHILVTGWKHVGLLTTGVNLYTNGKQGKLTINNGSVTTSAPNHKLCDLPSAYKPLDSHYLLVCEKGDSYLLGLQLNADDTKVLLTSGFLDSETWWIHNTLVYDLITPSV